MYESIHTYYNNMYELIHLTYQFIEELFVVLPIWGYPQFWMNVILSDIDSKVCHTYMGTQLWYYAWKC